MSLLQAPGRVALRAVRALEVSIIFATAMTTIPEVARTMEGSGPPVTSCPNGITIPDGCATFAAASDATISRNILTVGGTITGTFASGELVSGSGVSSWSYIMPYGTIGTTGTGGAGTYYLSNSTQSFSGAITASAVAPRATPVTYNAASDAYPPGTYQNVAFFTATCSQGESMCARQSGQAPSGYARTPPINVAGVDYPVGIDFTKVPTGKLQIPSADNVPAGCSPPNGGRMNCGGSSGKPIVLNGFNLSNLWVDFIGNNGPCVIENSYIQFVPYWTGSSYINGWFNFSINACAEAIFINNVVDGAPTHYGAQLVGSISATGTSGSLTVLPGSVAGHLYNGASASIGLCDSTQGEKITRPCGATLTTSDWGATWQVTDPGWTRPSTIIPNQVMWTTQVDPVRQAGIGQTALGYINGTGMPIVSLYNAFFRSNGRNFAIQASYRFASSNDSGISGNQLTTGGTIAGTFASGQYVLYSGNPTGQMIIGPGADGGNTWTLAGSASFTGAVYAYSVPAPYVSKYNYSEGWIYNGANHGEWENGGALSDYDLSFNTFLKPANALYGGAGTWRPYNQFWSALLPPTNSYRHEYNTVVTNRYENSGYTIARAGVAGAIDEVTPTASLPIRIATFYDKNNYIDPNDAYFCTVWKNTNFISAVTLPGDINMLDGSEATLDDQIGNTWPPGVTPPRYRCNGAYRSHASNVREPQRGFLEGPPMRGPVRSRVGQGAGN